MAMEALLNKRVGNKVLFITRDNSVSEPLYANKSSLDKIENSPCKSRT